MTNCLDNPLSHGHCGSHIAPEKLNMEKSMEMSFFTSCPITGGLSVPLQTVRTSNASLFSRVFVRVRRFEAAYRLVFLRAW